MAYLDQPNGAVQDLLKQAMGTAFLQKLKVEDCKLGSVAEGRQDGSELVSQNPTLIKHCVPDDGSDSLLAEHGGAQDLH